MRSCFVVKRSILNNAKTLLNNVGIGGKTGLFADASFPPTFLHAATLPVGGSAAAAAIAVQKSIAMQLKSWSQEENTSVFGPESIRLCLNAPSTAANVFGVPPVLVAPRRVSPPPFTSHAFRKCPLARIDARWFSSSHGPCAASSPPSGELAGAAGKPPPVTLPGLLAKYAAGTPISMVTAYDYTSAMLVNGSSVDMILIGDSLGMTMLGLDSTVPVTLDEVILHCRSVARGAARPFRVGDLPFGTYEVSNDHAVASALRLVKEGNVHAVKLEGGRRMADRARAIVDAGIPVVGHIGLTPQTATALGGFRAQGGRSIGAARDLLDDAMALQAAGVFQIVLEAVPELLAAHITDQLDVPTIGIGAGARTSGQVLVWHDMMGLYQDFTPKFSKRFADLAVPIGSALQSYHNDVVDRVFPGAENMFLMKRAVFKEAFPDSTVVPVKKMTKGKTATVAADGAAAAAADGATTTTANGTATGIQFEYSKSSSQSLPSFDPIPSETPLNVMVIGGGSLGSLLAARLSTGGAQSRPFDKIFLCSGYTEHLDAIKEAGLTFVSAADAGGSTKSVVTVSSDNSAELDSLANSIDVVVVAVKANAIDKAARVARSVLAANGTMITLQNGLNMRERLLQALVAAAASGGTSDVATADQWSDRLCAGVTSVGASLVSPGRVEQTGIGETNIALPSSPDAQARIHALAVLLDSGGLPTTVLPNEALQTIVWEKLAVSCAINPLTALLQVTNGALVSNEHAKDLMRRAVQECEAVAKAIQAADMEHGARKQQLQHQQQRYSVEDEEEDGAPLPADQATPGTANLLSSAAAAASAVLVNTVPGLASAAYQGFERALAVAQLTSGNRSSMLRDIDRGTTTEIDVINGAIVELGERYGVQTPINRTLHDLVLALQDEKKV